MNINEAHHLTVENVRDSDENTAFAGSSDSSVEGYEVIQPPVADLIPRPTVVRGVPLDESTWRSCFDEDGRVPNIVVTDIKMKIFSGVSVFIRFFTHD